MILQQGTNPTIDIQIVNDVGIAVTGLVAATFPTLTYSIGGANATAVFPALTDLTSLTTAYSSGGVKERTGGYYRVDCPSGVSATVNTQVTIVGEASGLHVICPRIDICPSMGLVAGSIDLLTFTSVAKELLGSGWLSSSAVTSPLTAGNWYRAGIYNTEPYWANDTNSVFAWNNGNGWTISAIVGTNGAGYFTTSAGQKVNGTWSAQGTATGTPVISGHGNAFLGGFQPESPTINANAIQVGGQSALAIGTVTFPNGTLASTTNITAATGITVATNSDKTGYQLAQAFPANFASMLISNGGYVGLDWSKISSPTTTQNLSGTTISTTQAVASVSGAVGSISGITFPSGFGNISIDSSGRLLLQPTQTGVTIPNVTTVGNVSGSVSGNLGGNVVGTVGAIYGVGFPSNFNAISVDTSGRVLLQPSQTGVTIPTVTSVGSVSGSVGSISGITFPSHFGAMSISAAGNVGIDWSNISNPSSTVNLSGTTVSFSQIISSVTGSVGSIAGVTFPANFSSFALDSSGRVLLQPSQPNVVIPTVTTTTSLTNAPTNGDFTATMKSSITGAVPTVTQNGVAAASAIGTGSGLTSILTAIGNPMQAGSHVTLASATTADGTIIITSGNGANQVSLSSGTVTIGTNNDKQGYALATPPPTAIQIQQEIELNSTKLANLDAAVSSRMAASSIESIATTTAAVLFVDGAANPLKVNSDHTVTSTSETTPIVNYVTIPAAVAVASQDPAVITCLRGDTLRLSLPLMGDITSRTKLVMTVKANVTDSDSQAVLQIAEGTGLIILNGGKSGFAGIGSLTVTNANTGALNLELDASVTAQFAIRDLAWDVQAYLSAGITTPISGILSVVADVTQSVT